MMKKKHSYYNHYFAFLLLLCSLVGDIPCLLAQECLALKNGTIPNVWLQIGDQRTASTLQYVTLILIGSLLCENENIDWHYLQKPWGQTIELVHNEDPTRLRVVKTHDFNFIQQITDETWIFYSGDQAWWLLETFPGHPIILEARVEEVFYSSFNILNTKYRSVFNLSDKMVRILAEVVEAWVPLRKCCGPQMSDSWRKYLLGVEGGNPDHECLVYNSTALEARYLDLSEKYHLPILDNRDWVGKCECELKITQQYTLWFNNPMYSRCDFPPSV